MNDLICFYLLGQDAPIRLVQKPKDLDPLGAIIYYICVTEAKMSGHWLIPGHRKIERMLREAGNKPNAQVGKLWNDLQWIIDERLLFNERIHDDPAYHPLEHRAISQHQISDRIAHFSPAFDPAEEHSWRNDKRNMDYREFVERKITAIRLIAFKDLYYVTDSGVSQLLLFEFLRAQSLADEDEYYGEGGFLRGHEQDQIHRFSGFAQRRRIL